MKASDDISKKLCKSNSFIAFVTHELAFNTEIYLN